MPLMDHLGELRRRLVICAVAIVVSAIVLYMVTPSLINILIAPIKTYLVSGGNTDSDELLVVLNPLGGFTIRFLVAFFASVIVCAPLILWEFMAFLLPALKPSEKKWVLPTFVVGVFLFGLGMVFCYFLILDPAFAWMTGQSQDIATILPDATEYIKLVMLFEIGFGIAFELPLIVFYLIVFNILPYKKLRAQWRIVYVVLLVISAVVTPDASPVTMFFMFAAMVSLYELSLFVSRIVLSRKIQSQVDEDDVDELAEAAGITIKPNEKPSKSRKNSEG